jgi:hypothetical protein
MESSKSTPSDTPWYNKHFDSRYCEGYCKYLKYKMPIKIFIVTFATGLIASALIFHNFANPIPAVIGRVSQLALRIISISIVSLSLFIKKTPKCIKKTIIFINNKLIEAWWSDFVITLAICALVATILELPLLYSCLSAIILIAYEIFISRFVDKASPYITSLFKKSPTASKS